MFYAEIKATEKKDKNKDFLVEESLMLAKHASKEQLQQYKLAKLISVSNKQQNS